MGGQGLTRMKCMNHMTYIIQGIYYYFVIVIFVNRFFLR